MKTWSYLKTGDLIDIVAPGSGARTEDLMRGLSVLKSWGFKTRFTPLQFEAHPFFSASDATRWNYLKKALKATDSKAIWCLRGGYGSNRLVESLVEMKPVAQPKLFIGYSDITTLHTVLNQNWKWPTVHGPLLETLGNGKLKDRHLNEMRDFLLGKHEEMVFSLKPLNEASRVRKKIKGHCGGGNLMVLAGGSGTLAQNQGKKQILVLEEIAERGYRVDRCLIQLKQSGALQGVQAIAFGDFIGGSESSGKNYVKQALVRFASEIKIPCYQNLEIGHGSHNRPLSFGTQAILESGPQTKLIVQSGGGSK